MSTSFQLFNLKTMSGVFPGTRTMIFQRVRVRAAERADAPSQWARLLWYDDPSACIVELVGTLLRIDEPHGEEFGRRLQAGLAAAGVQLQSCGSCRWWQRLAVKTTDGLAAGRCTWRQAIGQEYAGADAAADDSTDKERGAPGDLAVQSLLALDCSHWRAAEEAAEMQPPVDANAAPLAAIGKRAENESDERWTWWGRLRRRLAAALGGPAEMQAPVTAQALNWGQKVVERSGVGAGTESCFACQGRIANLGALAVASPEGDKQTFSIWRCRHCFTYYLNNWIDRWERTDTLETEESYYRLAPAEAIALLAVIDGVVDAEHPARRSERGAQRLWILQFIGERPVLSHQIKQGR